MLLRKCWTTKRIIADAGYCPSGAAAVLNGAMYQANHFRLHLACLYRCIVYVKTRADFSPRFRLHIAESALGKQYHTRLP